MGRRWDTNGLRRAMATVEPLRMWTTASTMSSSYLVAVGLSSSGLPRNLAGTRPKKRMMWTQLSASV